MAKIRLIGVPMDLGANRRGVDMGPSALRYAGLKDALEALGHHVSDRGNLSVPGPEQKTVTDATARYVPEIQRTCLDLAKEVKEAFEDDATPMVLGGDHSIAVGTLRGISRCRERFGVLWIDAHADVNTPETSPSGNVHGMALAAALGLGPKALIEEDGKANITPNRLVLMALRDVDPGEKRILKELGVKAYTMEDVDRRGLPAVVEEALARLTEAAPWVHVSLDMDALDPQVAPGVGTPVQGGLTYREGHLIMEMVAETEALCSMEVVEVNPILDVSNKTAQVAVGLVASAFGSSVM